MSFYGTVLEADAYHAARGNAAWALLSNDEKEQALTRASDYLDRFYVQKLPSGRYHPLWCGVRTSSSQARAWPRDNATFYGEPVTNGTTPTAIEHGAYEAALREAEVPDSLLPDFTPSTDQGPVTQETVGPLTVKYADNSKIMDMCNGCRPPNMPIIPAIDGIVAGYLCPSYDYPGVRVV